MYVPDSESGVSRAQILRKKEMKTEMAHDEIVVSISKRDFVIDKAVCDLHVGLVK